MRTSVLMGLGGGFGLGSREDGGMGSPLGRAPARSRGGGESESSGAHGYCGEERGDDDSHPRTTRWMIVGVERGPRE